MQHKFSTKVLVTVPHKMQGGVANYFQIIKKHFTVDVEYLARGSQNNEDRNWEKWYRMLSDFFSFIKKVRTDEFNLVHINTSLGVRSLNRDLMYIFLAKACNKKIVLFIHGWNGEYEKRFWNRSKLIKKIFLSCDAYIVLANKFKQVLKERGVRGRVHILSTTIDDSFLKNDSITVEPLNSLTILFLARIEKAKGIYETIDAFKIIVENNPHARLIIAGDGEELGGAREYVNREGIQNIDFRGFIYGEEKEEVFEKADIYLFPSYYGEGMPTTVLEAMAKGLPVITRPLGGIKDFFENGKMGYMTKSTSATDFAQLINKLTWEGNMETISAYNINYAENNFLASIVAEKIENIYNDVINE